MENPYIAQQKNIPNNLHSFLQLILIKKCLQRQLSFYYTLIIYNRILISIFYG